MTSLDASIARMAGALAEIERNKHRSIVLDVMPSEKTSRGATTKIVTQTIEKKLEAKHDTSHETKPEAKHDTSRETKPEQRQAVIVTAKSTKAMPKKSNLKKLLNGKKFDISK